MKTFWSSLGLVLAAILSCPALAQQAPATQPAPGAKSAPATQPAADASDRPAPKGWQAIDRRLDEPIGPVKLAAVPAKQAFAWWARATGVDVNINWNAMQDAGLDPTTPISLDMPPRDGRHVLRRLMEAFAPDLPMVAVRTSWYMDVMTQAEANRHRVLRVYDVRDLLPAARQQGAVGVVGTGGAAATAGTARTTVANAAGGPEEIARIIREMIEPNVWVENGGESTIGYFNGNLLVKAPLYVQVQIGPATEALGDDAMPAPALQGRSVAPAR